MESYSNYSYPDSRESSPRSREIDLENASWEEPPPLSTGSYKVKFMCSYGGKIQPRPHDNKLAYVGGDTKILAVDRSIKLSNFVSKLSSLCDSEVCFKYQLPGEDLDALISVTNDEDLEHMMLEYDRLYRGSAKPARLRLFLFPMNPPASFGSNESKSERQWFVDALNSVPIPSQEGSSPPTPAAVSSAGNPDFLFGFDKGYSTVSGAKLPDSVAPPTVSDSTVKDISAGSDCGSDDRHVVGEPIVSPVEFHRQMHDMQRLQLSSNEQTLFQRKSDEIGNPRAYAGDYYSHKFPEKIPSAPSQMPMTVPAPIPPGYIPERHMTAGGYSVSGASTGTEQPVYLIHTPSGMYQAAPTVQQVSAPAGQAYYGVQRMVPEFYRDAQVYNAAIPQQPKAGAYTEGVQMMQPQLGMADQGFTQVGYDSAGRQVYYTTQGGNISSYHTMVPVAAGGDGRQGGAGTLNQEGGKIAAKVSQTSTV